MMTKCECADPGCTVHKGHSFCREFSVTVLCRVDMYDETGTAMCEGCSDDAYDSGLFYQQGVDLEYGTNEIRCAGDL